MFRVWILALVLNPCSGVIYRLNDTEYARMPPLWELASYSRCMSQHGTYCVLQLSLEPGDNHQLMDTILEYSAHTSKHYNHSVIERGVCVTETCQEYVRGRTEDLKAPLEACLNSRVRRAWGVGARVSALHYCERHDERARSDAWDGAVRAALLALVAINAGGSLYDHQRRKRYETKNNNGNAFLLSFSALRNWERLMNMETRDPKLEGLEFIHGARVIIQMATIIMHVLMSYTKGFVRNPHDVEQTFDHTAYFLLYNGMIIVQLFFSISGFLTYFTVCAEQNGNQTKTVRDFPKIMWQRFTRLFPALAAVLALTTSWLRLAGSGPLWRLFLSDSLAADCRACWWHHLLFINNYTQRGRHCLIQTWHLAAEMQVYTVAVFAYLLSSRLLIGILLLSIAGPAVQTVIEDLDAVFITPHFFRTWKSPTLWRQHVLGHNNLTCFIVGLLLAQKLYEWKRKGGHLVISRWWGLLQYLSVAAIPCVLLTGQVFWSDGARASVTSCALYSSAVRLVFSLIATSAAFAFVNRTNTYLKSLLSWRGWVVPSRLSYCVYLLHMPLIHVTMGARAELVHYSFQNVMLSTLFLLLMTYPAAILLHLTVEAPCIALCKGTAGKKSKQPISLVADNDKHKSL